MGVRTIGFVFTGDFRDLDRAIDRAEARLAGLQKAAGDTGGIAKSAAAQERAAGQSTAAMGQAEKAAKSMAAAEAEAYKEAERRAKAQVKGDQDAARSAEALARAESAAYRENARRAATAERQDVAASKRRTAASSEIGGKLIAAGAITGVGIALAVKQFADFDKAMSRAAAGTDATTRELGLLRAAALKAGADTMFSATEAADAVTALGKAGVAIPDILGGGLKGALDLAAAGELKVGDAAEIAATAMTQFNLRGKDIPHVADLLAAGAGKAQGDVTDLAEALKYVGPVAHGMGVSIEETTGVLAEFASQGIIGEQAGTGLRGVLLSLTSPSVAARKEMKALGVNLYDSRGGFVGLTGVAGQLQSALGRMSASQRDAALGVIFGNEQVTSARVLYSGGAHAVEDWTHRVNDSGFAARQAGKLTDNLSGDLERLGGSLSTVFIQAGSGSNAGLRGLTQDVQHLVDAYGRLSAPLQQGVVETAALAAGTLLLTGGVLKAIAAYRNLKIQLAEVEAASKVTAAALAAITLVGVAEGANVLGKYVAETSVADVQTRKLADALGLLGDSGKAGQPAVDLFKAPAWQQWVSFGLNKEVSSTADAMKAFGQEAKAALGDDLLSRFARLQGDGAAFEKTSKQIDTALVTLAKTGRAPEAASAFQQLADAAKQAGVPVDVLAKAFPQYEATLEQAGTSTKKVAEATRGMTAAQFAAQEQARRTAAALKASMDAAEKATHKAFTSATDVLGSFTPDSGSGIEKATERITKAKQRLADTERRVSADRKRTVSEDITVQHAQQSLAEAQKGLTGARSDAAGKTLAAQYRDTIKQAGQFTRDIAAAYNRGLDPRLVARLLQEGPAQAGPTLRAILSDHSGRMIRMVNESEKKLADLNQLAGEQARIIAKAATQPTDAMTRQIPAALRIAQAEMEAGGRATAEALAKSLHLPPGEIQTIANEFGIHLAEGVQKAVLARPVKVKVGATLVTIDSNVSAADPRPRTARGRRGDQAFASGGAVSGPGTATSDSVPALLSAGEHVWTAGEVAKAGGHGAVLALRRAAAAGALASVPRFAAGGPVGAAARPVVVRVPVTETHTRTAPIGPVYVTGGPRDVADWARMAEAHT